MKDASHAKSSVLRDLPSTAQPRTLALPRHRHGAAQPEDSAPVARAAQAVTGWNAARPLSAMPPAPTLTPTIPSIEEIRASLLAEEWQRARDEGLRTGLADAQARVDEAVRQHVEQWQSRAQAERAAEQQDVQATLTARGLETDRLARVVQQLDAAVDARLASLEDDAIELAFATVCQMIGTRAMTRELVADGVRQAITQLSGATLHRVRLHRDDLALLADDPLRAAHPSVEWVADSAVTQGGCLLESAQGTLDTRLDRQLERLREVWLRAAAHERQGR